LQSSFHANPFYKNEETKDAVSFLHQDGHLLNETMYFSHHEPDCSLENHVTSVSKSIAIQAEDSDS